MLQLTRRSRSIDIWPGFVDALASVLLVFIFMLLVFVLAQFYAAWELAGREATITRLERSINELAQTLSLERERSAGLETRLADSDSRLRATLAERDTLAGQLRLTEKRASATQAELDEAKRTISAADEAIKVRLAEIVSLQQDIATLRELRAKLEASIAERDATLGTLRDRSKTLEAKLASAEERTRLAQTDIEKRDLRIADLAARVEAQDQALAEGRGLTQQAQRRVAELSQQISALRAQLAELSAALDLAKAKVTTQQVEIADLGKRLNLALARRVQELNRYRSEFFGRLREALGDRADIRIVGDRFVFQSEVLFDSASADLGPAGGEQIRKLGQTLNDVSKRIPRDLDWVLRIDGHTDRRPIHNREFPSNWELSTARALSIVRHLIAGGVPPRRLIATGFGQYRPLDPANTPVAWQKNRRIEIRFTSP